MEAISKSQVFPTCLKNKNDLMKFPNLSLSNEIPPTKSRREKINGLKKNLEPSNLGNSERLSYRKEGAGSPLVAGAWS